MRPVILALVALALAAPMPSGAAWSTCEHDNTLDVGGQAYVVYSDWGYYYFALWIYVESNGVPGLQRGGENAFGDQDTSCRPHANPDTLLF